MSFSPSSACSWAAAKSPALGDYARLLEKIQGRPDLQLLQTVMLRSLRQAMYSPDNVGHFGLAYEAYTSISPRRSDPDLLVHRAIKPCWLQTIPAGPGGRRLGADRSSLLDDRWRADEADRDVENWLKCYYMQDRIGEEFDGSVSAVVLSGFLSRWTTFLSKVTLCTSPISAAIISTTTTPITPSSASAPASYNACRTGCGCSWSGEHGGQQGLILASRRPGAGDRAGWQDGLRIDGPNLPRRCQRSCVVVQPRLKY